MEGLLIAEVLADVAERAPAERLAFRFLDAHTIVLPLVPDGAVWLFDRPPNPRLELRDEAPPAAGPRTGFQQLLAARATGPLRDVSQPKLDRIAVLHFGPGTGFVTQPGCRLVFELTGRNSNLILTDLHDVIIGAAREVPASVNRYRQIRPGVAYQPPPPYEKLDPRRASRSEMAAALGGKKLKNLHKALDGFGPELTRAVSILSNTAEDETLEPNVLPRVLDAVEEVAAAPASSLRRALGHPDVATLRRREERQELEEQVARELRRRVDLAEKRIRDAERTIEAADAAAELRGQADLLMAYPHHVPDHAPRVELEGFDGRPVAIDLDPSRGAIENAERLYAQARKRERRAERAVERIGQLEAERAQRVRQLEQVPELETERLRELAEQLVPREEDTSDRGPGIRFRGPHGFEVVVGRSAKENDEVTFRVARSRDLWLHVQGYHGAHVIVRAENREVPFDTVLFAAQLAAGFSKAREGENVPVDYTLKKNVWKVKGMPAGAVHYTQQKTVYVTPRRQSVETG